MAKPPTLPMTPDLPEEESAQGWIMGGIAAGIILLILCILLATLGNKKDAGLGGSDADGVASNADKKTEKKSLIDKGDGKKPINVDDPQKKSEDEKKTAKETAKTNPKDSSAKKKSPKKTKAADGGTADKKTQKPKGNFEFSQKGPVLGGFAPDTISFFDIEAESGNVVFVIDKSGSMAGERIERVKTELVKTIKPLKRTTKFHVVMFDNLAFKVTPNSMPATAANKKKLTTDLQNIYGGGSTNPVPAVELAFNARPDAIFILSDGELPAGSVSAIKNLNGKNVSIHTIGFANDAYSLKEIAKQNNGKYKFVK